MRIRAAVYLLIVLRHPCIAAAAGGDAAATANAAQNRDMNTVRTRSRQRTDVNAAQPDGTTALHWAAHWNDLETVNLLLSAGAKVNTANRYGATRCPKRWSPEMRPWSRRCSTPAPAQNR